MVRFSSFNSRAAQKGKRTLKGLDNFDVCVVVGVSFSLFVGAVVEKIIRNECGESGKRK